METKRLYRSDSDVMVAGVCSGLADYLGVDPTVVRLLAALLLVAGMGSVGLAYLVMAVVVPVRPQGE